MEPFDLIDDVFSDRRRPYIRNAIDRLIDDWLSPNNAPVLPTLPCNELAADFQPAAIPCKGTSVRAFIDELLSKLIVHTPRLSHPRCIEHRTQTLPAAWLLELKRYLLDGNTTAAKALNTKLNSLNEVVQEALKEGGKSFISRTSLESSDYPGDTTVLRLVLTNLRTKQADLEFVPEHQRSVAQRLLDSL